MVKYLFYDQNVINQIKNKINELNNEIKKYSNLTSNEYDLAKKGVNNHSKSEVDKHNNQAVVYYEIILKLKAELEILLHELAEAEAAPRLSADKAKIAAAEANNIATYVSKIIIKGGSYEYNPNLIIEIKTNIEKIRNQIKDLSNKTTNEYSKAKQGVNNHNKLEVDTHNNQAVIYYQEILKLKAELEILLRRLKQIESAKSEKSDEGLSNNGPALFTGVHDPKNKFIEGDYVVVTGSNKPEKQKFIGKTGKVETILDVGVGKNTSNMTRYDVNFGNLGSANFKESRLIKGESKNYEAQYLLTGGESYYYEKYKKYRNKYLALKSNN